LPLIDGRRYRARMGTEPPTIDEWGGGRAGFERWLNAFYDLVESDELIAPLFGGTVGEEHRHNVTTWWCQVMGGPAAYAEWGSRLAVHNSQPDAEVTPEAPVPHWGRGVAPPYDGPNDVAPSAFNGGRLARGPALEPAAAAARGDRLPP
jgi:Bacterial-like globin